MINVTLPDGSKREFADGASPLDVAESISKSLAKKALAARVNGELRDLKRPLDGDSTVAIVTDKDADGLELIRHDAAHVLAQAVQALYPDTQVTIGPVIDDGFYYDFARKVAFSTDDFEKIEAKMKEIVDADYPIVREVWEKDAAIAEFKRIGEDYKARIIDDIIPPGEAITLYRQGDWFDLCRGPHLPSTGKLPKAFKLMKMAGAYWRGDHRNEMLQRMYGTAWASEKDLKEHLTRLEEAEKRDHRKLGAQLDLFHLDGMAAAGSVFWHPNGWTIWRALEDYIRALLDKNGYREVKGPQLLDRGIAIEIQFIAQQRQRKCSRGGRPHPSGIRPFQPCPIHDDVEDGGNIRDAGAENDIRDAVGREPNVIAAGQHIHPLRPIERDLVKPHGREGEGERSGQGQHGRGRQDSCPPQMLALNGAAHIEKSHDARRGGKDGNPTHELVVDIGVINEEDVPQYDPRRCQPQDDNLPTVRCLQAKEPIAERHDHDNDPCDAGHDVIRGRGQRRAGEVDATNRPQALPHLRAGYVIGPVGG